MRERCAAKRQQLIREVAKQVNARRTDYRAVIVFVNELRTRFGNWQNLADEWFDTFQTARKAKKHDLVVRIWRATFSIISACDQAVAADAIPVEDLSHEELPRLFREKSIRGRETDPLVCKWKR